MHDSNKSRRPGMQMTVWMLVLLLTSLTGCSSYVEKDGISPSAPAFYSLQAGQTIGQTFVAHHAGLAGVEVFLQPESPGDGEIVLHLRADPDGSVDRAVARLPIAAVTEARYYRFSFAPQPDSRRRDYYLLLEISGSGQVQVGSAPGEAYLDGALYHNGEAVDAQAAFRQVYDSSRMLLGMAREAAGWAGVALAGLFVYLLPGLALLILVWPGSTALSWAEKAGLAFGLSLALYPLLLLWTDVAGLHLGPLYAWAPGLVGLVALAWRQRGWRPGGLADAWRAWIRSPRLWPQLALLGVIGLVVLVRFLATRPLDVPMWGDSYQHTMMAQLVVDRGGLFRSWEPYAELQTFTYHFGFHTAVAVFHWVTGFPLPAATLWTGQILNVLACIALYPLALRLTRNQWAGVGAVLVAGLLAPMPMFYVNWGRYTQLGGQTILPASIYFVWAALETRAPGRRLLGLAWIGLAGLALTHYRVLIFGLCFLPALWVVQARRDRIRSLVGGTFWLGAGAALLAAPWYLNVFGGKLLDLLAYRITTPAAAATEATRTYNAIGDVSAYLPVLLWLLLPLAAGFGLWRRERGAALVALWWFLVLLAANPQWLHLPGEGTLTNFAVFIAAYIPAAILLGGSVGWIASDRDVACRPRVGAVFFLLAIGIGAIGARERLGDLRVDLHALVTRPDLRAAAWIREQTPEDARFLVNSFFAYGGSSIVGSDGGWWLPLLARRQTTLPPLTYSSEEGPRPDYHEWINALWAEIEAKGIDDPDVLDELEERGVTHVYVGQRQGRVNAPGPPVLDPAQLVASPNFRPVYHEDRVWIFELIQ